MCNKTKSLHEDNEIGKTPVLASYSLFLQAQALPTSTHQGQVDDVLPHIQYEDQLLLMPVVGERWLGPTGCGSKPT